MVSILSLDKPDTLLFKLETFWGTRADVDSNSGVGEQESNNSNTSSRYVI